MGGAGLMFVLNIRVMLVYDNLADALVAWCHFVFLSFEIFAAPLRGTLATERAP